MTPSSEVTEPGPFTALLHFPIQQLSFEDTYLHPLPFQLVIIPCRLSDRVGEYPGRSYRS